MARRLAIEIFVVLVVGLVLGIFGPFGTFATPTAPRIAYWMVFGLAGYAIFRPLIIVGEWVSAALSISRWIGIAIALVIAALPMTLIIATVRFRFDVSEALRWDGLGQLYFQVWLIGFIINGLTLMLFGQPPSAPASQSDREEATAPPAEIAVEPAPREQPLIDRLPAGFDRIHALGSEDHYVRVYGDDRDTLILMRLRDAVMAMGNVEGMQVHRSWWVARASIGDVQRDGRALTLRLINGTQVPVSREFAGRIRAAGWIDLKGRPTALAQ